jgi:hypothetical protein
MSAGSKPDNSYRLVLFEPPEDPLAVRDLICGVTGLHPTDVMQWVARTPGVIRHPLTEGEVRELLDALFEMGVPAEAWRLDALPNLSPPRTVHGAACLDNGLRITGLRGEPTHWVPWDRVELIAAGRVEQDDEVREVVPPNWVQAASMGLNAILRRPQVIARRQRTMRTPREPVGEAIIVRRDPRIAFRMVETNMNYASLGERLRPSASVNFPIWLADVCRHATHAFATPSTNALLEGGDPGDYTFPTSQALLDYATHRLLWNWYRRDRDAGLATES